MNKFIAAACLVPAVLFFAGCTKKSGTAGADSKGEEKIKVVATIFPEYDWAKNLAKGSSGVEVELLIKNGTDLHSYQPSTQDIVKIGSADIFIYVGGESDKWVAQVLKNSRKENQLVVNLMELLAENVKEEELTEGMQEEAHSHEAENEADGAHEEAEYDEHVWLSVQNAKKAAVKIAECLEVADLENSNIYAANLESYLAELDGIEQKTKEVAERVQKSSPLIFCDRFPFRYLTDELGAKYFAAFAGCSAETEASFETVAFLVQKTKETDARAVFVTESSDRKLAQTVVAGAGLLQTEIVVLNSMQSVTQEQADAGASYTQIMLGNLSKITSVLE